MSGFLSTFRTAIVLTEDGNYIAIANGVFVADSACSGHCMKCRHGKCISWEEDLWIWVRSSVKYIFYTLLAIGAIHHSIVPRPRCLCLTRNACREAHSSSSIRGTKNRIQTITQRTFMYNLWPTVKPNYSDRLQICFRNNTMLFVHFFLCPLLYGCFVWMLNARLSGSVSPLGKWKFTGRY